MIYVRHTPFGYERFEEAVGMSEAAFSKVITDYVFDSIAKEEKEGSLGYEPRNGNYHDHMCDCPGCNYDGEYEIQEKENKDMNTAENNNGKTFKVGDRVKSTTGDHGTITTVLAQVNVRGKGIVALNLNNLTHYDGPTSEEDAWERVTMDIAGGIYEVLGPNGYLSFLNESYKRSLRHEAYTVLGSVLKIDEQVKARVRGIIERAEKRFTDRN